MPEDKGRSKPTRQADGRMVTALMKCLSGEPPRVWGQASWVLPPP